MGQNGIISIKYVSSKSLDRNKILNFFDKKLKLLFEIAITFLFYDRFRNSLDLSIDNWLFLRMAENISKFLIS